MLATRQRIGRFDLQRQLGTGAQGSVWQAHDPRLNRTVAIKTLHLRGNADQGPLLDHLLREARSVSRLRHANVVTLFDAGDEDGQPYLVFEYVQGTTLAELVRREAPLSPSQAVTIALQILAGVASAHDGGIIHRDLKPANIMLDADGTARIMDFGIAHSVVDGAGSADLAGTPRYLAPECFDGEYGPSSDIYAVGMILYEMLTGRPANTSDSLEKVIYQASHGEVPPPSAANDEVDERLDALVARATARRPDERFPTATAMSQVLRGLFVPQGHGPAAGSKRSTLEFLFRRMKTKSDFPALSEAIRSINRIQSADEEHLSELSNLLLRDYALTNKLLRLVNSAFYRNFGGVSTVSRAINILGFETIRNLALALILFENLQNRAQAAQLKDAIVSSFFCGVIGREITDSAPRRTRGEESFICAMFQNLGRLLVLFYFHDEAQEIARLIEQQGIDGERATTSVLGVTFEELGIATARYWNFPDKIVRSMARMPQGKLKKPADDAERLQAVSNMARELRDVATQTSPEEKQKQLKDLAERYHGALALDSNTISCVVDRALQEFAREARELNIDSHSSVTIKRAHAWGGAEPEPETPSALEATIVHTAPALSETGHAPAGGGDEPSEEILAAGIQDITNTLVGEFKLNELMRMILETMFRGMSFSRALLCLRERNTPYMAARLGFGDGIDALLPRFRFSLREAADVFHLALNKGVDVYIADCDAQNIGSYIPAWYRQSVGAASFLLLPVLVDKKPVSLLYADYADRAHGPLDHKYMSLLKTLRNQAVLAIKQRAV
jgi:serine/threonine protein kinase